MSDIQHVNVKIFARPSAEVNWPDLIPVFHRWIQQQVFPQTLIDVADYAHVPSGPGVMLIGHEAWYSLDNREGRIGFLYNRRTPLEGSVDAKLAQAYSSALDAARRLESEPEFLGKISFDETDFEIFINDRLLAPNTEATWKRLQPEIERFSTARSGRQAHVQWNGASRELFRVHVQPLAA